jgi:hypothetical protein
MPTTLAASFFVERRSNFFNGFTFGIKDPLTQILKTFSPFEDFRDTFPEGGRIEFLASQTETVVGLEQQFAGGHIDH